MPAAEPLSPVKGKAPKRKARSGLGPFKDLFKEIIMGNPKKVGERFRV